MIKTKQELLDLISFFIVLIFISCGTKKSKSCNFNDIAEGKILFYENCSACHTPRNKDQIFRNYMSKLKDKNIEFRTQNLITILGDENHFEKGMNVDTLTTQQIKAISDYVVTPIKIKVVN